MLNNDFVKVPSKAANVIILMIVSFAGTVTLCSLRPLSGILVTVTSIVLYYAVSVLLFGFFNLVIVTFYPMFALGFAYVVTVSFTQGVQSVERMYLFKQATHDGLTQLYNVRHFNLLLESEFKSISTLKFRPLSIIMADIDNFKRVNDTYGHASGDLILKEVASIIQSKCRQLDVVGRYGGEEFIVMLSGAKAQDAANLADKMRQAVAAKKFKLGNVMYSTTISMGVAQYTDEKSKNELVDNADKALYQSKRTGKDKVTIYSPQM